MLAFGEPGRGGQQVEFRRQMPAVEVGRADLDGSMPHSRARNRASGISSWMSGKKKIRLPSQAVAARAIGLARARARRRDAASKRARATPKAAAAAREPGGRAFRAEREGRGDAAGAARFEQPRVSPQERLGEEEARVRADGRQVVARARPGRKRDRAMPSPAKRRRELVLDHVGERADDEQRRRAVRLAGRSGTSAARQASSPCVNVVSMPLPE